MKKGLFCVFLILASVKLQAQLIGNYAIGPSGPYSGYVDTYASITAANTALASSGVSGPVVFELQSDYLSSVETFPLVFPQITGASLTNTIRFRPAATASNLSINRTTNGILTQFNGGDFITIDGRPGGTSTTGLLTLFSSGTGSQLIDFYSDAINDTISYCNISGNYSNSTGGLIQVGGTAASTTSGNDNLGFINNIISGNGNTNNIFYIGGTSGFPNDNITISNNNISDFFSATHSSSAINMYSANNNNTTISGNHIYQTATRTYNFASSTILNIINLTAATNTTVSNNVIGGSSVNAGGAPYTLIANPSNNANVRLFVINSTAPTTGAGTSIQGNIIRNISLTSGFVTSGSSVFIGINGGAGIHNIGGISGNTIGSSTSTGSITINNSAITASSGPLVVGINAAGASTNTVNNNVIGGITTSANRAAVQYNVYPISISSTGSPLNINSNTIGGTVNNSINITNGDTTALFSVRGINFASGATGAVINVQNNTIQNITLSATPNTGGTVAGIYANPSNSITIYTITGNTIRNISSSSNRNASITTQTTLCGILITNTAGSAATTSQNVSNNAIHSLINTSTTTFGAITNPPYVSGIIFTNGSAAATKSNCTNNIIHSLQINSKSTPNPVVNGIYTNNVALNVINNSIRLGIDKNGTSLNDSVSYRGIFKVTSQPVSIFNNTVYIGGSAAVSGQNLITTSSQMTAALYRSAANALDTISSNIFINKRSNASGNATHYAILLNSSTLSVCNYNIYFANGTGGFLGSISLGGTNRNDINFWRTGVSGDVYSAHSDVTFTNATGDAASVSLLPTSGNNLIGLTSGLVPTDILSTTRASIPTCGAYELSLPGIWKAAPTDGDWNNANNWVNGLPASGSSIYIPATTSSMPTLATSATIGRLLNLNTGVVTVNGSNTLTVNGEIRNSGTLTASLGTIDLAGSTLQTLNGINNFAGLTTNNVAGSTIVGGTTNITDVLTLKTGLLTTGGLLTLKSTSTTTARVDPVLGRHFWQRNSGAIFAIT